MGCQIKKLIRDKAPSAIKLINLSTYANKKIAIDASIYIYRFCYNPLAKGKNPHVIGFYNLLKNLLLLKITPIVIFDGAQPEIKRFEIEKRKREKEEKLARIAELSSKNDKESLAELEILKKRIITFSDETYTDIINICNLLSVQSFRAKFEADSLCLSLYKNNMIDAILSEDNDILMGGCEKVLSKFNYSNELEETTLSTALESLSLTYEEFVEVCILTGTDYTKETLAGMGPVTSYNSIKKYGSIDKVIVAKKYKESVDFDYRSAKEYILNSYKLEELPNLSPFSKENIKWDELKNMLIEKCNFKSETLQNHVLEFNKVYKSNFNIILKLKTKGGEKDAEHAQRVDRVEKGKIKKTLGHTEEKLFNQQFGNEDDKINFSGNTYDCLITNPEYLHLFDKEPTISLKCGQTIQFHLGNIPELSDKEYYKSSIKVNTKEESCGQHSISFEEQLLHLKSVEFWNKYLKKGNYYCHLINGEYIFIDMDDVIKFIIENVSWRLLDTGRIKGDLFNKKGVITFEYRKDKNQFMIGACGGRDESACGLTFTRFMQSSGLKSIILQKK